MLVTSNVVTREEIIARIKELAEKDGRRPSMTEVCRVMHIGGRKMRKLFGTYGKAVKLAGLSPIHSGMLTMMELFEDWAAVAGKIGRIPTIEDYKRESRYSPRPLRARTGSWRRVPEYIRQFGDARQLWTGREDVQLMLAAYANVQPNTSTEEGIKTFTDEVVDVNLIYGEPLSLHPMATAPENENGVLFMFGAMARELGFVVLKVRPGFPDIVALRRLPNGKWRWVRIELERDSRNFLLHDHDPKGCDLIVCWEHNWEECPLEVVELRKLFENWVSGSPKP